MQILANYLLNIGVCLDLNLQNGWTKFTNVNQQAVGTPVEGPLLRATLNNYYSSSTLEIREINLT